jgi:hypothetical protein
MSATRMLRKALTVSGSGKRDGRFVRGRAAAVVEDQPRVGELKDDRVTVPHHLGTEHSRVIVARSVLIGDHEEMCDDEAVARRKLELLCSSHRRSPFAPMDSMTTDAHAANAMSSSQKSLANGISPRFEVSLTGPALTAYRVAAPHLPEG